MLVYKPCLQQLLTCFYFYLAVIQYLFYQMWIEHDGCVLYLACQIRRCKMHPQINRQNNAVPASFEPSANHKIVLAKDCSLFVGRFHGLWAGFIPFSSSFSLSHISSLWNKLVLGKYAKIQAIPWLVVHILPELLLFWFRVLLNQAPCISERFYPAEVAFQFPISHFLHFWELSSFRVQHDCLLRFLNWPQ